MNHLPAEQIANQALITQVLHEVLTEKPFLVPNACQCHLINPNKIRLLLWKDIKDGQETYILKIAEQKFVGVPRQDKRGEIYWKFRDLYESESKPLPSKPAPTAEQFEINQPLNSTPPKTDRLAKFQERQAKSQQLQAKKEETKWLTAAEHEARLAQEKAERESQKLKENHAPNSTNESV